MDENIYYQPEAFGLKIVYALDGERDDYGFDLFVVWQDAEGRYFYGYDSGCS